MKVKITKVEQRQTVFAPQGTPPYVYEISFITESGMKGSIEMFHNDYTPDAAIKKIKEEIVPKAEMAGKEFTV